MRENKNISPNPSGFCARRRNRRIRLSEERPRQRRIHGCGNCVFGGAENGSRWCRNDSNGYRLGDRQSYSHTRRQPIYYRQNHLIFNECDRGVSG